LLLVKKFNAYEYFLLAQKSKAEMGLLP